MVKSILTVVDGTEACEKASAYSYELAKKYGAKLSGLSVLDIQWAVASQTEPLGGTSYNLFHDESIIEDSHKNIKNVLSKFKERGEKNDIEVDVYEMEGLPLSIVEYMSTGHDLLVVGQTMDFHFRLDNESQDELYYLVKHNPRPLVFVPESYTGKSSNVYLLAYDGSVESANAIHMFLLLNMYDEATELHIVTIDENADQGAHLATPIQNLCKIYGLKTKFHYLEMKTNVPHQILEAAKYLNVEMILLDSKRRGRFAQVLFGSASEKIISESKVPVFVSH